MTENVNQVIKLQIGIKNTILRFTGKRINVFWEATKNVCKLPYTGAQNEWVVFCFL